MSPHPHRRNHSIDTLMIMKSISYETVYVCRLQVTYIINRPPPPPLIFSNQWWYDNSWLLSATVDGPSLKGWLIPDAHDSEPWKCSKSNLPTKMSSSKINQVNLGQLHSPMAHPIRTAQIIEILTKYVNICTKSFKKLCKISWICG